MSDGFTQRIVSFHIISACHASLKDWQSAYDDALLSISKDPKFIKGYYRLASAQTELMKFDDAETTLRAALTLEPGLFYLFYVCTLVTSLLFITDEHTCCGLLCAGNEVLLKQIRTLKAKKTAALAASKQKKAPKQLDEATIKEVCNNGLAHALYKDLGMSFQTCSKFDRSLSFLAHLNLDLVSLILCFVFRRFRHSNCKSSLVCTTAICAPCAPPLHLPSAKPA